MRLKNRIGILVTAAGGAPGYNVINALKQQKEKDVRIVAADIDPLSFGLYLADKHYLIPRADHPQFIDHVFSLCRREKIGIIFPGLSPEYPVFSKNKKKFEREGIKIPISDWPTVKICADKIETYRFFKKTKIPSPNTYLPEDLPRRPRFPLVIKPRVSSGTKDVYKVKNNKELKFFLAKVKKPIIQEFIEGQEYTIDAVADFTNSLLAAVPRIRLKVMDGKSVRGVTIREKGLISIIESLVKDLKIIGPANIQCFKKGKRYLFTEVNCRFAAGGLPLTVAAGVNVPLLLLKICLGENIKKKTKHYKEGLFMVRYLNEIFIGKRGKNNYFLIKR